MANKRFWLGILAMVLVFGMTVVACDDGATDGPPNGDDDQELPPASGVNAVGGKTYYKGSERIVFGFERIVFSTTTEGITNGTFTRRYFWDDEPYSRELGDGKYTWNEKAKTVTLKHERVMSSGGLIDKATCRQELQADLDDRKERMGETAFNQMLAREGFSSATAAIDYMINELFGNKTYGYSFSNDGTALFLKEPLPANRGTNELSGQTYLSDISGFSNGLPDFGVSSMVTFTATDYTFGYNEGSYAYNSFLKRVYFRPSTVNGQNRAAYYETVTVPDVHYYPDDNAYRAAITNDHFSTKEIQYNNTDKRLYY